MPDVEIYTQPWCPYLRTRRALAQRQGRRVPRDRRAARTPERAEATRRSGGRTTVPQIFKQDRT